MNMAKAPNQSRQSINDEEQIEFDQAMQDFRVMFPSLDPDIIEAVLRANKGAVDDTIDQLLMMTMEDSPNVHEETIPKTVDDKPGVGSHQMFLRLDSDYQRQAHSTANASHVSFSSPRGPINHIPDPDSVSPDLLMSHTFSPTSTKKIYKPPLVGRLPPDFLRLDPPPSYSSVTGGSFDEVYDSLNEKKSSKKTASHSPKSHSTDTAYLGIFRSSTGGHHRKPHKGLEHSSAATGLSPRRRKHYEETSKQADHLKDKMLENEWRRQVADDPELSRYLEDERIALMLQNREFLKDLRRNRDFMSALERDSIAMEQERELRRLKKKANKKSWSSGPSVPDGPVVPKLSTNVAQRMDDRIPVPDGPPVTKPPKFSDCEPVPDGPTIAPKSQPANSPRFQVIDSPSREETVMEGYDIDDLDCSAEPFPHTKPLPKSDEPEMAFQDKMKYMGKASRKKFALMARRFSRKTKGAKGMLGTGSSDSHYSGMYLLDETDDKEEPSAYDTGGYNQPEADYDLGIGNKTDLKEGRLFSK